MLGSHVQFCAHAKNAFGWSAPSDPVLLAAEAESPGRSTPAPDPDSPSQDAPSPSIAEGIPVVTAAVAAPDARLAITVAPQCCVVGVAAAAVCWVPPAGRVGAGGPGARAFTLEVSRGLVRCCDGLVYLLGNTCSV